MNETKRSSGPKSKLIGGIMLLVAVVSVFVIDWRPEVEEPPPPIRPLKTVIAGETAAATQWKYPGKASAGEEATLAFEVAGTVKELLVREGEQVKNGQVLARLDDRDYQNAMKSAQAEVDRAQAQFERVELAAKSNAVSEQEVSNARAALDKAKADLDIQSKAVEDTVLTARFAGTVAQTFIKAFENVQAKQQVLSLQNLDRIEIKASIPEARLALVDPERRKDGEKHSVPFVATFDYFSDRTFPLEFKEFATEADPVTQTFTATFVMDAPTDVTILPGMTAMVAELADPEKPADPNADLLLPLDVVPVDGLGQYFVWKVEPEEGDMYSVTRQDVSVGELTGKNIIITAGLTRGDRVAAAGVHILVDGQRVRLLAGGK